MKAILNVSAKNGIPKNLGIFILCGRLSSHILMIWAPF